MARSWRACLTVLVGITCFVAGSVFWPWLSSSVSQLQQAQVLETHERLEARATGPPAPPAAEAGSQPAPASRPTAPPTPAPTARPAILPRAPDFRKSSCSPLVKTRGHKKLSDFDLEMAKADRCKDCYLERMQLLYGTTGADIVMGANDGSRYDPAWWLDYWNKVPLHTKVFVEPVPPIYAKLKNNTARLPHAMPLNNAVRSADQPARLNLYCWDLEMVERAVRDGSEPLPKGMKQPKEFWAYLCATDKRNVLEAADVQRYIDGLPLETRPGVQAEVERHILHYPVEALTPKEIVQKAGPSEVRYVQIDVEGLDNEIVRGLPFGEDGFKPNVILYENHNGDAVKPLLESHGYYVCCCFNKWGNNMLAVLNQA